MPTFPQEYPLTSRLLHTYARPSNHRERFSRATRDGWFPPLYQYAKAHDLPVPDSAPDTWRNHALRIAINRAEMRRILDELRSRDIRVAILKGEPLARLTFDDPHLRSTVDIDLLVTPTDRAHTADALRDLGFVQDSAFRPWTYNQVAFNHPDRGTRAELHWSIAFPRIPTPPADALLRHTDTVDCDGLDVPILPPVFNFLELCYHFHQHRGFLKGLLDIAAWLDRLGDDFDWHALHQTTADLGLHGLVTWPLATIDRILGTDTLRRTPYEPTINSTLLARWTTHRLHRRYIDLAEPPTAPDTLPHKLRSTAGNSLAMTVLDAPTDKLRGALRPILEGPHFLGTAIHRLRNPSPPPSLL